MADVVGVLRSWRDGALTIERRDGTIRRVPEDDLVAARVVPVAAGRRDTAPSDPPGAASP